MDKYKKTDGSGIVFNTLGDAVDDFCKGKSCETCPLDKVIGDDTGMITCCDWAELYQAEAAKLMGLEIIREEPLEADPATNLVQEAPEGKTMVKEVRLAGREAEIAELPNVQRHWHICDELNRLYERKNHDYGDSFHQSFQEEGMAMARIRLGDKLNRFKTLSRQEIPFEYERKVKDESIRDTLIDLANYSIMTVMEMEEQQ